MSLVKDAIELSAVLNQIVADASASSSDYPARLADPIRSDLVRYDEAVFELRSREAAAEALSDIAADMSDLGAVASKGELPFWTAALLMHTGASTLCFESHRDDVL